MPMGGGYSPSPPSYTTDSLGDPATRVTEKVCLLVQQLSTHGKGIWGNVIISGLCYPRDGIGLTLIATALFW